MVKSLRTVLLIILILSLAAGLLAQLKTNPKGVVGKIGSKTYTFDEYNGILNNYYEFYQSKEGKLTPERKKALNDQCWNELIGRIIYDNEIKRRRISVTDQEALDIVMKDPPIQVKQIEALQTDGKFDVDKFKQAMDVDANFKGSVLNLVKEGRVYDKLLDIIRSKAKAKPDSVKNEWLKDNNLADASIIYFDWTTLPEIPVQNSEAISYYNTNKESYKREPARKYRYVKITADKYFKVKADSIYDELKKGADFAEMAKQLSDDPGSGKNGGDLGWFGRNKMVKPFADKAFSLELNEISEPVLSQFGWHIIQTLERRTTENNEEEVHARHILVKSQPTDSMKVLIELEAELVREAAKTTGLVKAALDMNLTVEETGNFFETDRGIREIGQFPELIKYAFNNTTGYIPAPVAGRMGEAYVCELSDSLGVHYSPLEKEKNGITQLLEREKRYAANKARAHDFYDMHSGADYLDIAQNDSLKIIEAKNVKEGTNIPDIGLVKELNEAILATEQGQYTSVVENDKNAFLTLVTKREKPDMKQWNKLKGKLIADALDKDKKEELDGWYYKEYQKLDIEDNRKEYFDLPKPQMGSQQIQLSPQ